MIYNLFDYLQESVDFPGLGLFRYISFRAISAVILSMLIALFVGKRIINKLAKTAHFMKKCAVLQQDIEILLHQYFILPVVPV